MKEQRKFSDSERVIASFSEGKAIAIRSLSRMQAISCKEVKEPSVVPLRVNRSVPQKAGLILKDSILKGFRVNPPGKPSLV